jgi:hypothetical protein
MIHDCDFSIGHMTYRPNLPIRSVDNHKKKSLSTRTFNKRSFF